MRRALILAVLFTAVLARAATAQPYTAQQQGEVVRLQDATAQTVVSIIPGVGNVVFEMAVKGQNILRWPYASIAAFKAQPGLSGIPFVGPWANRLDEPAFYANDKKYAFDMALGNVRGAVPIHGFLSTNRQWQVVEVQSDASAAWVTSRLEFYRQPSWVRQWPFAHTIEITHRLQDGTLEVRTSIANLSVEPMPVAIGFHPYFQLTDSPRDAWRIAVGSRPPWLLAPEKVPTGQTEPIERLFPDPKSAPLNEYNLDDVFGDLVRDARGRATMTLTGKAQRLDVLLGPNYRAVVIYAPSPTNSGRGSQNIAGASQATAPSDRSFVCFEPMAAVTNALNLAHKGLYKELQSIPPGETWRESFWVRPSGF